MPGLDPVEHLVKIESRGRGEASFLGGMISRVRRYRRPDIPPVRSLGASPTAGPALSPLLVLWRLPDGDRWPYLRDEARAARPPVEWRFVATGIVYQTRSPGPMPEGLR